MPDNSRTERREDIADESKSRERFEQPAELLYDLFRAAPIPVTANGQEGRAVFFDRDAQKSQARVIMQKIWQAAERDTRERCAQTYEELIADRCTDFRMIAEAIRKGE